MRFFTYLDSGSSHVAMPFLTLEQVSIDYEMRKTGQSLRAVQAVRFTVEKGEFVAIVGPSGCGKTSLLKAIDGLIAISSGTIRVQGETIQGPNPYSAMVFQSPALLPWRTVLRNVSYGLELRGITGAFARQQAEQFIQLVGLQGFESSYPGELSGGMQQRVNLARALAVQPLVLLMDEPLSALDAQTRDHMLLELQRIWMETRPTCVYITHQISEAIFLADRILVMTDRPGQINAVIPIDIPRPRRLFQRRDPQVVALEEHIWQLLQPRSEDGQYG